MSKRSLAASSSVKSSTGVLWSSSLTSVGGGVVWWWCCWFGWCGVGVGLVWCGGALVLVLVLVWLVECGVGAV